MDLKNSSVDFAVRAQRIVIENGVVEAMGILASLFNEHSQLVLERWMREHVRIVEIRQRIAVSTPPEFVEREIERMRSDLVCSLKDLIVDERSMTSEGDIDMKMKMKVVK
jgi:hypothetical protein